MREIIFRGKNIDDSGKWEYGYYFKVWVCHFGKRSDEHCLHDYETDNEPEVYPDTIGQYTGLTDKNGTKVFEGDVVRLDYDDMRRNLQVVFDCGECDFKATNGNNFQYLYDGKQTEVIGNIHDTPELLKSEED